MADNVMVESIMWGCVAFGLSLVIILGYYMGHTMIDAMESKPQVNQSTATINALRTGEKSFDKFDYVFFGFFIGATLAIIIAGFLIGGHPIMMVIYFLVLVIGTVASSILSNVWYQFTLTSTFADSIAAFPITNHIMMLLPMYVAIVGMIGMIAMFAKPFVFNQ